MRVLNNLVGEFVSAQVVKAAAQREYNQSIWNNTVDRYSKYDEVRFFKMLGTTYEFDYYVIYIADGIRFLGQVSYGGGLSNGGFAYGFFTEGLKDQRILDLLKDEPGMELLGNDSLTILSPTEGRLDTSERMRDYMRSETSSVPTRFFTRVF